MNVQLAGSDAALIWILAIVGAIIVLSFWARAWADRARYRHRAANYRAEADLLRAKRDVLNRDLYSYEVD